MLNYVYGIVTSFTLIAMVDIIDSNVPNSLKYWVTLYVPF
jgi:hypothetical protein